MKTYLNLFKNLYLYDRKNFIIETKVRSRKGHFENYSINIYHKVEKNITGYFNLIKIQCL